MLRPGQCGSVGWSVIPEAKSHGFDFWSGHMLRLWVWSLLGYIWEAIDRCFSLSLMFLSLSLSIPTPLSKINKHVLGEDKKNACCISKKRWWWVGWLCMFSYMVASLLGMQSSGLKLWIKKLHLLVYFVCVRNIQTVENLYKNLFEPNTGYTWKQYLSRVS